MLEVISFTEFTDDLEKLWHEIEINSLHYIFQRYSWNAYWFQIFKELYNVHIVLVRSNSKPIAIFPFCINRKGKIKFLQFIGTGQSDYLSPLIDKNFSITIKIWKMVLSQVEGLFDVIRLSKIPAQIKGVENQFVNLIGAKMSGLSFGINLPENYNEFDSSLKRNFRNDNKRNLKRLSEFENLRFLKVRTSSKDYLDFKKHLGVSLEQKARRLKNYMGNKTLNDSLVQNFYQESYNIEDDTYKLDYTILIVMNDQVLATHWGFFDNDRYYFLFPTMEGKDWYKYSCGKVLIDHLIEFAISRKIKYFDFTIGDENYKKDWCNSQMNLFSYTKAESFSGLIYLFYLKIITIVKGNKFAKYFWRRIKSILVQRRKRN